MLVRCEPGVLLTFSMVSILRLSIFYPNFLNKRCMLVSCEPGVLLTFAMVSISIFHIHTQTFNLKPTVNKLG